MAGLKRSSNPIELLLSVRDVMNHGNDKIATINTARVNDTIYMMRMVEY